MGYADQASMLPTNKLAVAGLIGPAVTEAYGNVMLQVYEPLSGPSMAMLAGAAAAYAVGWFVPDRPNVPR